MKSLHQRQLLLNLEFIIAVLGFSGQQKKPIVNNALVLRDIIYYNRYYPNKGDQAGSEASIGVSISRSL